MFRTALLTALLSVLGTASAFAGYESFCVPEIDGAAGISALALLASVGAVLYRQSEK